MANLYGVNRAKIEPSQTSPMDKIAKGQHVGRIRFSLDMHDLGGRQMQDGDLVWMMQLPSSAIIVNSQIFIDDVGAAGTFAVGKIAPSFLEEGAGTSVGSLFTGVAPNGANFYGDLVNSAQAVKGSLFYQVPVVEGPQQGDFSNIVENYGIKCTTTTTNSAGIMRLAIWYVID